MKTTKQSFEFDFDLGWTEPVVQAPANSPEERAKRTATLLEKEYDNFRTGKETRWFKKTHDGKVLIYIFYSTKRLILGKASNGGPGNHITASQANLDAVVKRAAEAIRNGGLHDPIEAEAKDRSEKRTAKKRAAKASSTTEELEEAA